MTLYHYSERPFILEQRNYTQGALDIKPKGLWLSVEDGDDGWKQWCIDAEFCQESLTHRTEIYVAPDAHILHISTLDGIDRFTEEFSHLLVSDTLYAIDWAKVARQYQGIIIAPYQWERRLAQHSFWYYGWDCASGCVWDLSAVHIEVAA